jgi:GAF domain-containing protein/HAMP domain-containing protein
VRPHDVRPRSPRLQTRLATAFAILALLSSLLVSIVLTITIRNQLLADIRDRVQDAVAIGALQIDGDAHSTLVDSDQEGGDTYNQLKSVMQNIRDAGLNYRFVYTLRYYPADRTMYFIVDAETDPEYISHLMDAYTDLPPQITRILSTLDAPYVEPDFYTDEWGRWLTGYAPVYTSDGHVDAVLAMDVDASLVIAQTNRVVWISLIILAGLIPFVVLAGWQLGKRISDPIVRLTQGAEIVTAGNLDHTVQITTRDETSRLAQAFNTMTARLRDTIAGLEQTVTDRTRDVELRSSYLRAAAEVGRAATSILDSPQLIQQVVESIRTRFDLYYVGLFLVDSAAEYAVLQAGTGQAGKAMLARNHRIRIGEGMIGWSVANKRPRVALEAAEDAVRLVTDLLPLTRSEAALPLISRTRVLGALTVQSERSGLFTPEIISVLQTMADQVALALDNARLFSESEAALDALQRSFGQVSQKAWSELLSTRQTLGYRLDQDGLHPLSVEAHGMRPDDGRPDAVPPGAAARPDTLLKLPIRLREQVLGVIEARKPDHAGPWSQDEIEQLTSLVDQLSVALENARLYEDTQTRAEQERILAEITTKVRATTDINTILQTAVLELATALNVPQGAIRLGVEAHGVRPDGVPPGDLGARPAGMAPNGGSAHEQ